MGGGVGHKATNAFTQAFAHEARNWETNPVDDVALEGENEAEDLEEEVRDVVAEEDYGYVIDSDTESSDEEEEDDKDLGGEDGEEPWEMDDVQAEGFDDL